MVVTSWSSGRQSSGLPQVELGLELQGAGRADRHAVAAVDAGRLGQGDVELGGDAGVHAPAGDGDREGVLGVVAARLDALVAEDALVVVADVEVVLDLDLLVDPLDRAGLGVPLGIGAVVPHPPAEVVGLAEVDGGAQELQHHAPAVADPRRVGLHDHAVLDRAGAGRHQGAGSLDLDHADPAGVDRGQVLGEAQRRRVDVTAAAGVEEGRPVGTVHVDRRRSSPARHPSASVLRRRSTSPRSRADRTADAAVWPSPQIEASAMAPAMSSMSVRWWSASV